MLLILANISVCELMMFFLHDATCIVKYIEHIYNKTSLKPPLKNRQNKDLNDKW